MNPECRAIIRRHSKSFSLAASLLPPDRRDDAVAVYAWCRRVDDAVDLAGPADAASALARSRRELDEIYNGDLPADPVLSAFRKVVLERRLPAAYPADLLEGMAMDVEPRLYDRLDDLLVYCHRVAGVVGLMMCHVLGVSDDRALVHAAHLGIAMQLTNVCRDVEEDRRRGRCYLPLEMLSPRAARELANLPGGELTPSTRSELRRPIHALLNLADRYYASGDRGIGMLSRRSGLAIRTARLVYSEIGRRIAATGCDLAAGRAYVPAPRKFRLLARALAASLLCKSARPDAVHPPRIVLECRQAVELRPTPAAECEPTPWR
jgi:phytoene synthase